MESVFDTPFGVKAEEQKGAHGFPHAMLDLETMGPPPRGAIISIGLCYFNIKTAEIGPTFERNVDVLSSVNAGMERGAGELAFWARPEQAEALEHVTKDPVPLRQALMELMDFLAANKKHPRLWGNGSCFDNTILGEAFKLLDLPFVHYRQWKDMRTWVQELGHDLLGMRKKDMKALIIDEGMKHTALDDAVRQAKIVSEIYMEAVRRLS